MNCEQFESRFNDLLDARQPPHADAPLQEHLRGCSDCRTLAAAQEAVFESIAAWPPLEPSAGLTERVLAEVQSVRSARRWMNVKIAALAATAAAILIACWPALLAEREDPRLHQVTIDVPVRRATPEAVLTAPSTLPQVNQAAVDNVASQASEAKAELTVDTEQLAGLSNWASELSTSLSLSDARLSAAGIPSAATDWMGEVTTGLEPMKQSTVSTLQSLLYVLPPDVAADAREERAS